MDLFYSNLTEQQQLNKLKNEIKTTQDVDFNIMDNHSNKFKIIYGSKKIFGNCCLILYPHVTLKGFMGTYSEKKYLELLEEYEIQNYIISYCIFKPCTSTSRPIIQAQSNIINNLISIVSPKFIVSLGEDVSGLFIKRKPIIEETHASLLESHLDIPVILTYHPNYYFSKTGKEDKNYRNFNTHSDLSLIKIWHDELTRKKQ